MVYSNQRCRNEARIHVGNRQWQERGDFKSKKEKVNGVGLVLPLQKRKNIDGSPLNKRRSSKEKCQHGHIGTCRGCATCDSQEQREK